VLPLPFSLSEFDKWMQSIFKKCFTVKCIAYKERCLSVAKWLVRYHLFLKWGGNNLLASYWPIVSTKMHSRCCGSVWAHGAGISVYLMETPSSPIWCLHECESF
jgi:hypothetical protein